MTDRARKIVIEHVYPPIPAREFDYAAWREGYEPGDHIGRGRTQQEAIDDLLEQERDISNLWPG